MSGIPVLVRLDGATFKELESIAKRNGCTIADMLSEAGRRIARTDEPRKKRGRRRDHDHVVVDEWVVAYRMGVSVYVIAERYKCAPQTVRNRLEERGVLGTRP